MKVPAFSPSNLLSRPAVMALAVALVTLSTTAAFATPPDPKAMIEAKYAEIQRIVTNETTDAGVQAAVIQVLESFTDFEEFGRRTIKRFWPDLTPEQRALFVAKYRQLIHKSYVKHFKPNKTLTVTFRAEPRVVGDKALVQTTVTSGDTTADVDYKLHLTGGQYMAYDLVIDDVSLMRSYRRQFTGIMKNEGFDALIEKMTRKIETGSGDIEDP